MKKLFYIFAFLIATNSIIPNPAMEPSLLSYLKNVASQEIGPFRDSPIISSAVFATGALWTTCILYYGINYWKEHKGETQIKSPVAFISPAIIIGYIAMRLWHQAFFPTSGPIKLYYDTEILFARILNQGLSFLKSSGVENRLEKIIQTAKNIESENFFLCLSPI
jgi:hypothetical protein